jgi:hypothetical protein
MSYVNHLGEVISLERLALTAGRNAVGPTKELRKPWRISGPRIPTL